MGFFKKDNNEELASLQNKYDELQKNFDTLQDNYNNLATENSMMLGKMDYVEELLVECESMQKEWAEIVKEAKEARDHLQYIIRALSKENYEKEHA